jgi:hypothetical protein
MRKYLSVLPLALLFQLAGCSDDDPTPDYAIKNSIEQSRYSVVNAGLPLEVDGCLVQVHQVFVTRQRALSNGKFTLATAKCPTAQVVATNESCGKSCEQDTLLVTPLAASDVRAQERAKKEARLKDKQAQLQRDLAQVSAELEKQN